MSGWKCFMIRESSVCRRELRRYADGPCSMGFSIHDISVVIDPELVGLEEGGFLKGDFSEDPRWPKSCLCGRPFTEIDHWQVHVHRLYSGAPDGKLYALHDKDLPAGAMWEAPWNKPDWIGSDGRSIVVQLPSGTGFPADAPSTDGARWTRTGTPPQITLHPSINEVGRYHGNLIGGVLSRCVEGNQFPIHPDTA